MLFPVAGARLFTADSPSAIPAEGWVEIGETEALGSLGGRHELVDGHYMAPPDADNYFAMKGVHRPNTMQVLLGLDSADRGQLLLFQAYRARDPYPFRLLFADGVTERRWLALVMALEEVFDEANQVMRLQVDLHPSSSIQR